MKTNNDWMKSYKLTPNFTLGEMTYSDTAVMNGIDNTSGVNIRKLKALCQNVLQPIRDHFLTPVKIISGYRSPKLNSMLSGAAACSQHTLCEAADIKVQGVSNQAVVRWIAENLDYDIALIEYPKNDSSNVCKGWVHITYCAGHNRKLDLTTEKGRRAFMLSPNFSLWELTNSATANARKIYNVPNEGGIEKLQVLCQNVLQKVRDHFGKAVKVSSGFRSIALNAVIKGAAKNSQHMKCEAADFEIIGMDNHDLANWVKDNLEFDQLILEYHGDDSKDPNDGWVHTSFVAPPRVNRKQVLTIDNFGTRRGVSKG